jgi:uncharacterized protein (TIGR04255 family)
VVDDLFPDSPRVIFEQPPIVQVVAQVLFPTILRLEQTPADFQERVRDAFPLYDKGPEINIADGIQGRVPPDILQILSSQIGAKVHRFSAANRQATITLTSESLAVSATSYSRWEHFLGFFRKALSALVELYAPAFFTRIGLRYVNVISRERLQLPADTAWSRLIRPEVLGKLSIAAFESHLSFSANQTQLTLPDGGAVVFQHGVLPNTRLPDAPLSKVYTLDFDFSRQGQIGVTNAEPILVSYHTLAGRAFRWCLTPELRDKLGPRSPD